jgi:hypothetical protein
MSLIVRHNLEIAMDDELSLDEPETPEAAALTFSVAVKEIAGSPVAFASLMRKFGDHRSVETISRSIQRFSAGDVRLPGEMRVVVEFLRQRKVRGERLLATAQWQHHSDGHYTATVAGFSIAIHPASKGRWRVNLVHEDGFSPSWPQWQPSLEKAKAVAIECLLGAQDDLDEVWAYNQVGGSRG